jgi:hypothetical protein
MVASSTSNVAAPVAMSSTALERCRTPLVSEAESKRRVLPGDLANGLSCQRRLAAARSTLAPMIRRLADGTTSPIGSTAPMVAPLASCSALLASPSTRRSPTERWCEPRRSRPAQTQARPCAYDRRVATTRHRHKPALDGPRRGAPSNGALGPMNLPPAPEHPAGRRDHGALPERRRASRHSDGRAPHGDRCQARRSEEHHARIVRNVAHV